MTPASTVVQRPEPNGVVDGIPEIPLVFIDTHAGRFIVEGDPETIYANLAEGKGIRAYELIKAREARERSGVRGLLRSWTRGRDVSERGEGRSLARVLRVHPAFTLSHVAPDALGAE